MSHSFIPVDNYKAKFYQREHYTKKFSELSEEQLAKISKKVYKAQEKMTDILSQRPNNITKLERYKSTLEYLINPKIHSELKTFDERLAFLIMMTDPNLITFKEFLKLDLPSITEIDKIKNPKERNILKEIRTKTLSSYQSRIREKLGFFDAKLLKYEEMYFNKFFSKKELITEIGSNNQDKLLIKSKVLKDFNSISDKRYEELIKIAQTWLSLVPEKYNYKIATYSITNQKKLLGITTLAEQLALFILLTDSNLDVLKIYEEESTLKNIEKRIIEEFGYFNKDLLILEKKFYNRFCPNKSLSIWTKIKKR